MKKKVMLHIIMPSQISGPNNSSRMIANSFLKNEFEFVYLTQNFHAGGKINIKLIMDLYRQISSEKPDLIHLNGLQASGFHAVIAAKLYNKAEILMAIRGFSSDSLVISKKIKFIHSSIIEPLTLKLVDSFYTVCEFAGKKRVVQKFKKKYFGVIYNSAPIISKTKYKSIRDELHLDEKEIIVAAASRIVVDKGYEYTVDVIKRVVNEKENVTFLVIGEGQYLEELKRNLKDQVTLNKVFFLNKRTDVKDILKESDIFIFPTLHENLSNSLLEAAVTKNAIIATKVGGNTEVISDGETGILINARNSFELYEQLLFLIDNESVREELAENAINIIGRKFSQTNNLKVLRKLYLKILKDE